MTRALQILFILFCSVSVSQAQIGGGFSGNTLGGDTDYLNPKKYTIASTVITGVDYYQHDAIRLISGLLPGKEITIPGDDISARCIEKGDNFSLQKETSPKTETG